MALKANMGKRYVEIEVCVYGMGAGGQGCLKTNLHVCVYIYIHTYICTYSLPWLLSGKESTCNAGAAGDMGSIPGWGRSPGGGPGSPLQCSCLESPMDRGAWWVTVHRVAKNQTQLKLLSTHVHKHTHTHIHTYTCNGILLSHNREQNNVICSNIDGPHLSY